VLEPCYDSGGERELASVEVCFAVCLAATLLLSEAAGADPQQLAASQWLTVSGTTRCSGDPEGLASRILEATIGTRDPELWVELDILDGAESTAAMVRLALGSRVIGAKRIVAPTCEDALDAAVAVVALALSSKPEATVAVGAGAAVRIGSGELRAIGWYGVPSTREEVSAIVESTRSDFAAAGSDYCHGIDAERWVALCVAWRLA